MKTTIVIFSASAFLIFCQGIQAHAAPACKDVDQFAAVQGTTCVTSSGAEFIRFQHPETKALGWQDTAAAGKIWFDPIKKADQIGAREFCKSTGNQSLPTLEDFQNAESRRIRELLKDMRSSYFWSSSLCPGKPQNAYVYVGYDGLLHCDSRDIKEEVDSARCVSSTEPSSRACSDVDEKTNVVGTSCVTSAGVEFVRYRDPASGAWGWKDTGLNGKIWFDKVENHKNLEAAKSFCESSSNQVLPNKEDFELAEKHGFRELLYPNLRSGYFWSASSRKPESFYAFIGRTGKINDDTVFHQSYNFYYNYVICVSQVGGRRGSNAFP